MSDIVELSALAPAHAETAWRDHHPLERTLLLGGLLLAVLLTNGAWVAAAVLCTTTMLARAFGHIPMAQWTRGLLIPLAFLLPATVVLALRFGDPASPLPAGAWFARDGVQQGSIIAIRTLACVSCTLLFIHVTPLPVVVIALRRAGVPPAATDTLLITSRLVELLGARLVALSRALVQRHGTVSWRARLRSVSLVGATLLVDALERSVRLERGLAGRGGLGGDVIARPTWLPLHRMRLWCSVAIPTVIVLLGLVAGRGAGGAAAWW